jgi:hypothetical protein
MYGHWQRTFKQLTFWVVAEIVLNLAGLDNLADYSEFVFEHMMHDRAFPVAVLVAMPFPAVL